MKLPSDAPEWLEPVVTSLNERAIDMVCNGDSAERGAGYMRAVEDLKVEIENKAQEQRERNQRLLREVKLRA